MTWAWNMRLHVASTLPPRCLHVTPKLTEAHSVTPRVLNSYSAWLWLPNPEDQGFSLILYDSLIFSYSVHFCRSIYYIHISLLFLLRSTLSLRVWSTLRWSDGKWTSANMSVCFGKKKAISQTNIPRPKAKQTTLGKKHGRTGEPNFQELWPSYPIN